MAKKQLQFSSVYVILSPNNEGAQYLDIQKGDILTMKKPHPCGGDKMLVLRSGMDFKLRCTVCGREFMIVRAKAEKNIKAVDRTGRKES